MSQIWPLLSTSIPHRVSLRFLSLRGSAAASRLHTVFLRPHLLLLFLPPWLQPCGVPETLNLWFPLPKTPPPSLKAASSPSFGALHLGHLVNKAFPSHPTKECSHHQHSLFLFASFSPLHLSPANLLLISRREPHQNRDLFLVPSLESHARNMALCQHVLDGRTLHVNIFLQPVFKECELPEVLKNGNWGIV